MAAQPLLAAFGLFCTILCNLLVANVVFGRVVRELNRLAERDPLTGMLSGSTLERSLDYEWRQGAEAQRGVAVLVLTIDDMAGLRSAHGEAIGDLVIAEAALQFKLLMRPCDVLGHEGQGRFLMVLHATSASFAMSMARSAVHVLALDDGLHPEAGQQVTLSVGPALQPEAADPRALLALARARRDAAWAAGGNRVEAGASTEHRAGAGAGRSPSAVHTPSAEGP